ncbi:MAG: aldehyde dehydrogenase (NADP(+)) [Woeseiaceae bacterium]
MLHGQQLIAGQWVDSDGAFESQPVTGSPHVFSSATPTMVDRAAREAANAFSQYAASSRAKRADFLEAIAQRLEAGRADITQIAGEESGLPDARLQGELGRTTGQLKLFATALRDGAYLDRQTTEALPDREPLPRPELKLTMRPIGPVVVFGASNFPLAFSTAGGDTASALAAGCPVIVKGHPAHPGTGELVARAIASAAEQCGMPPGVFSFLQDAGHDVARALVQHPLVKAVGFTGSLKAGRLLLDLCAARDEPIPFFGELGSINPGFVLPQALAARSEAIGSGWAQSLTMGAGQFCTKPGVMFVVDGEDADRLCEATVNALSSVDAQVMLTDDIASHCHAAAQSLMAIDGVTQRVVANDQPRQAAPYLLDVSAELWAATAALREEVFGPVGILVRVASADGFVALADALQGQLTATLHMDDDDAALAATLLPILEQKAGRLLANGFPTGVEVDAAMMHGGPYPASTNVSTTSVGTLAIRRFLKPVCYQNFPRQLLPADAQ